MAFKFCFLLLAVCVLESFNRIDAGMDMFQSIVECGTAKKGTDGGSYCALPVGPKVVWNDAAEQCMAKGGWLANPMTKKQLQTAYTTGLIVYAVNEGYDPNTPEEVPECTGPTWIDLNDKETDAGADGDSANWKFSDATKDITDTDMMTFWVEGFPMDDAPGGVVPLDCVAALALDADAIVDAAEVPPQLSGGLLNLPCTSGLQPPDDLEIPLNFGTDPPPGGIPAFPDIAGFDNLTMWCPLCFFNKGEKLTSF